MMDSDGQLSHASFVSVTVILESEENNARFYGCSFSHTGELAVHISIESRQF
jgi:hypothetical protein